MQIYNKYSMQVRGNNLADLKVQKFNHRKTAGVCVLKHPNETLGYKVHFIPVKTS
jgi:hypothetical protein